MSNLFLSIQYDEPDQKTYRAISVSKNRDVVKDFTTGNITVDFIDFMKWVADEEFIAIVHSSSWDHFFMDGDDIVSLLVDHNNNHEVVSDTSGMSLNDINMLTEYPVPSHITSFEELKKYYYENREDS